MTIKKEEVEDVEMAEVKEEGEPIEIDKPLPMFPTVSILQLVKDSQQQHGLRHGDYNRYRSYCRSKLKRIRKVLKFTNTHKCVRRHKAKFTKKWVTEDAFNDERFIQLCLFESERRWAQAMSDKMALEDNPEKARKKFAMRTDLKRAVLHATTLESLVRNSPRCDAPTKLEAQAYASWLHGICNFELRNWDIASESLKTARTVYERLAEATHNTTLANMYKARCREIQPQLRLCEFNNAEAPSVASMSELMAIRMQIGGSDSVDKLISEMRSKASSDDVVVVEWAGEKATVEDDRAKQVIQGWRQAGIELAECQTPKEKMALYEKQLGDTRDALDKISDLIRRKTADNADSSVLQNIKTYLEFLKLNGTGARYLALIENTKSEKKVKPQDLLRLYDSVIEIFKEVMELPNAAIDQSLMKAFKAKVEFYKAFKCHYMAAAYASMNRFGEAAALFNRANERITHASTLISQIGKSPYVSETKDTLKSLAEDNEQAKLTARTRKMAVAAGVADADEKAAVKIDERPLSETLDEWREWSVSERLKKKQVIPIVHQQPALVPMPNKPVFFDLALNHIKMPDLEERIAKCTEKTSQPVKNSKQGAAKTQAQTSGNATGGEDQSGLSGMVKGWMGWGKK